MKENPQFNSEMNYFICDTTDVLAFREHLTRAGILTGPEEEGVLHSGNQDVHIYVTGQITKEQALKAIASFTSP